MNEGERNLDRRRPVPSNQFFEIGDDFDPTETRYLCGYAEGDALVVALVEDVTDRVQATFPLNADKCRELSTALLRAADALERGDFREASVPD